MARNQLPTRAQLSKAINMCRRARGLEDRARAELNRLMPAGMRVRVKDGVGGASWTGTIVDGWIPVSPPLVSIRPDPGQETSLHPIWQHAVRERGTCAINLEYLTILSPSGQHRPRPTGLPAPAIATAAADPRIEMQTGAVAP